MEVVEKYFTERMDVLSKLEMNNSIKNYLLNSGKEDTKIMLRIRVIYWVEPVFIKGTSYDMNSYIITK